MVDSSSDVFISQGSLSILESSREVTKIVGDLWDDGLERKRVERGICHYYFSAVDVSYLLTRNAPNLHAAAHRLRVLQWLSPYEHDKRHREIHNSVKDRTGQWFLAAPTFKLWLDSGSSSSPILWCPGIRELLLLYLKLFDRRLMR
jgi:hypothetical protein